MKRFNQKSLRCTEIESAERLAKDTEAYFQALNGSTAEEESRLEAAVADVADKIKFDE